MARLSNIKRPERPQAATKEDDHRNLSTVAVNLTTFGLARKPKRPAWIRKNIWRYELESQKSMEKERSSCLIGPIWRRKCYGTVASGIRSLVFIGDRSRMNVYRDIPSAETQPNAAELIRQHITV